MNYDSFKPMTTQFLLTEDKYLLIKGENRYNQKVNLLTPCWKSYKEAYIVYSVLYKTFRNSCLVFHTQGHCYHALTWLPLWDYYCESWNENKEWFCPRHSWTILPWILDNLHFIFWNQTTWVWIRVPLFTAILVLNNMFHLLSRFLFYNIIILKASIPQTCG